MTAALAFGLVLAMAVPLGAAELKDAHQGTYCPRGTVGTWHFVNPQTGGETEAATLFVMVDGGSGYINAGTADKVNRNNQHWTVTGGRTLDNARTLLSDGSELPGKLVLSDYWCRRVKKGS